MSRYGVAPVPNYRRTLDGDIEGLRIESVKELNHSEIVEPKVLEALINAGSVLGELGAVV